MSILKSCSTNKENVPEVDNDLDPLESVKLPVQRHDEYQYIELIQRILDMGIIKDDRTGVGTKSLFGAQMR